jgi:hypothetical protein
VHHPLARAELAVYAPMDEQAELRIGEPAARGEPLGGDRIAGLSPRGSTAPRQQRCGGEGYAQPVQRPLRFGVGLRLGCAGGRGGAGDCGLRIADCRFAREGRFSVRASRLPGNRNRLAIPQSVIRNPQCHSTRSTSAPRNTTILTSPLAPKKAASSRDRSPGCTSRCSQAMSAAPRATPA